MLEGMKSMDRLRYAVSDSFYTQLFSQGSEPLLIVDGEPNGVPAKMFVVRYIVGSAGEHGRPIFRNELTGYDYEQQIIYPKQNAELDGLQSTIEDHAYGSPKSRLARVKIGNSKGETATVKVIISNELVSKIINVYQYAW
jgi:hypothetical protein